MDGCTVAEVAQQNGFVFVRQSAKINLRESNGQMKMSSAHERSVTQRDEIKSQLSSLLLGVSSRSMVGVVNTLLSVVVNKTLTSCWALRILIQGKHCMFQGSLSVIKFLYKKFCVIEFFLLTQPLIPNREGPDWLEEPHYKP